MLRLPDGMRDRIADAAKGAGRSMNAEIIDRLQSSFDKSELEPSSDMVSRIAIAVTLQLMQGIQTALKDASPDEQGNISQILDIAGKDLIASFRKTPMTVNSPIGNKRSPRNG
ncbi:Arc family DNA-binding protein [Methylobacterium guangdongense]|uniref:Arc family DNA-binding protein n=1 Tax=Methylobacterium guangdongense TaxID=3138811 RepID=UPI00399C7B87